MSRQISSSLLRPGMRLGRTLYDEHGRVLLSKGVEIREGFIVKIQKDFAVVYIDDEMSEGIEIKEAVPIELRLETQSILSVQWELWHNNVSLDKVSIDREITKLLRDQMKQLLFILQGTTILQEDLSTVATYDNQTYVHSINVAIYALIIGVSLGLSENMLVDLGLGAMLHDIGKIWVPVDVLNKPGKLTTEEYEQIKKHAELGHDVLVKQHELSYLVAHCAYQHHERLNGTGYPRGLVGDDIHLFGKIIAVADVYDAMVMHRPYRRGMLPADVMEYLYSRVDTEYDLNMVALFSKKVSMYPIGTEVKLSDGRTAIVKNTNPNFPGRPIVRVIQNERGEAITPEDVNLIEHLYITIVNAHDGAIMDFLID